MIFLLMCDTIACNDDASIITVLIYILSTIYLVLNFKFKIINNALLALSYTLPIALMFPYATYYIKPGFLPSYFAIWIVALFYSLPFIILTTIISVIVLKIEKNRKKK